MFAIYLKELKSLFRSFYGWAYLSVMTLFSGIYLIANNFAMKNPYISSTLGSFMIVPMFVIPLLTMKVYSEEKKQKTEQLIMTTPISVSEIIWGKFLALASVVLISVFVFFLTFLILLFYGEIPIAENLLAILAFYLFCLICIAVGLLLSSITEHQFISAILTYVVYLGVMFIPSVLNTVFPDKWFTKFVSAFDYVERFLSLFNGMILIPDVVYIVSVLGVLILLSYFTIGKHRFIPFNFKDKKYTIRFTVFILGIVLLVGSNFLVALTPVKDIQFDLTKRQLYSISNQTQEVLDTLDKEIVISVIGEEKNVDQQISLYLADYARHCDNIKIVYESDPLYYTKYTDSKLDVSSMIVKFEDESDHRIIDYYDCFEFQYVNSQYTTTGIDLEGQVTAAINSLINEDAVYVYELTGHNETNIFDAGIIGRFNKGGYVYAELNLIEKGFIPDNAECIFVSGPSYDLTQKEISLLSEYSKNGGNLILFASLPEAETPNYDAFIESIGVTTVNDYICETDYTKMAVYPHYIWGDRQSHVLTTLQDSSRMVLFPSSKGYIIPEETDSAYYVTSLFNSSDSSVSYKEYQAINGIDVGVTPEELQDGPFSLAFFATSKTDTEGDIIVIASGVFLIYDSDCAGANSEFLLSVMNELFDVSLNTTIPVKSFFYQPVVVPTGMWLLYGAILILVIPMSFVIAGIVICILRRKR